MKIWRFCIRRNGTEQLGNRARNCRKCRQFLIAI